MFDSGQNDATFIFSVKLCTALKKHECLYINKLSTAKITTPECEAAWGKVSEECGEPVETCKMRWKDIRRYFVRCVRRNYNKYYLNDHLEFLIPHILNEQYNNTTGTTVQGKINKNGDDKINVGDENNVESDSDTTSADETHVLKAVINKTMHDEIDTSQTDDNGKNCNEVGDFLIKEIDTGSTNNDEDHDDDMYTTENNRSRLRYKRTCKRRLDAELLNELSVEQKQEEKRPRRSAERRKNLSDGGSEEFTTERKSLPNTNKIEVKVNKIKLNKTKYIEHHPLIEKKATYTSKQNSTNLFYDPNVTAPIEKPLLVDNSTITNFQTRDSSTQYYAPDQQIVDFDDAFINSLKPQLKLMNGRQKMNFKRKVFQSIMEVFDDATNFPNTDECIVLPPTGAPRFDTTTHGELRLMRELVSLVQAAKTTPEIVNATEKVTEKPATPKLPEAQETSSPILVSPSSDEDDINFAKLIDDEEPLPRSLEEILDTRNPDQVLGLPRHIIHKVVKVAGTNGSTIVTGEGSKRRVYRIYPKATNLEATRGIITKPTGNTGTFYVTPSKVANSSTTTTDNQNNRPKNTTPNFTFRAVHKSSNNSGGTIISANRISSNVIFNKTPNTNTPKANVTPILNQSTGLFTMPYAASKTPPPNNNRTKSPMLPPVSSSLFSNSSSNKSSMRIVSVKSQTNSAEAKKQNTIMQRRYSICGTAPAVATPPTPVSTSQPKPFIQKVTQLSNGNSMKSAVSNIIVSKPVTINKHPSSANPNVKTFMAKTSNNATTTAIKKAPIISNVEPTTTYDEEPACTITPDTTKKTLQSTQESMNSPEIPILETAGTIAADTFADPLYVKPSIKSEPLD